MTTPAAARLYEAQHLFAMEGKRNVTYNPNKVDPETLPRIYGFNNGGGSGWYQAIAIAEDGHCLGGHTCSSEGYMPHDLGILEGCRLDRHEKEYSTHYPEGYVMEWVPTPQIEEHEKLNKAFELNNIMAKEKEKIDAQDKCKS
jgi:hypothetical protein